MNIFPIQFNRLLLFALACFSLIQIGCKKDNNAAPSISKVRLADSTKRDSTFTRALPGSLIVIEGQGFNGLLNVYFNDVDAPFNSAIISNNSIVVRIPAVVPTEATNPNVSNKIKLVTNHGEATYDFTLVPPTPAITAVSNEMALPGSTITITGSNFYAIQKVVFPGNLEGTGVKVNAAVNELTVTVPAGLTAAGPLQIINKYGTGTNPYIRFNDEKQPGMLATFDYEGTPLFGWAYWGGIRTGDAGLFAGNRGNYIRVHPPAGVKAGDAAWYADNRVVNVSSAPLVATPQLSDPIGSYALKFEMFMKTPWKNGTILIRIGGDAGLFRARFTPYKNTSNGIFQTTGWTTISIPLTEFKTKSAAGVEGAGDPASSLTVLMNKSDGNLQLALINDSADPMADFDAAFDNIRIVRTQ